MQINKITQRVNIDHSFVSFKESFNFNRDNILNYQRKLIESPFQSLPKPTSRSDSKYSICQLNDKIQQLIGETPHNLRWIGCTNNSYIEAYVYCLLMLSIQNNNHFLMFKAAFYQLSRKYLDVKKQKLIVQFLCLIQFTHDKYVFLKKYPFVEETVLEIFRKLEEQNLFQLQTDRNQQQQMGNSQFKDTLIFSQTSFKDESHYFSNNQAEVIGMNKLVQTYSKFSKKFSFFKWNKSSDCSFIFSIQANKKMHILIQKQYFFVIQLLKQIQVKSSKSRLSKGDKIQVQRLLNSSQVQSQVSLHQKLNFLNQSEEKNIFKIDQNNSPQKKTKISLKEYQNNRLQQSFQTLQNINNYKKQANFWNNNLKNSDESKNSKKQHKFMPPFPKKNVNHHSNQVNNKIIKQNQDKKLQYIDLMQSSFQEQKNIQALSQFTHDKSMNDHHNKFSKMPKYTPKPLLTNHFPLTSGNNSAGYNNSHFSTPTNLNSNTNFNQFSSIQNINSGTNTQLPNSNTHQSSFNYVPSNSNNFIVNNYHNKTVSGYHPIPNSSNLISDFKKKLVDSHQKSTNNEVMNRSRQTSQTQHTILNGLNSHQNQRKQVKSKQIKFYSPHSYFKQSPEKRNLQKQKNQTKKINDFSIKEKRKQQFKELDKKYYEKKQQIVQKIKSGQKLPSYNKFPTTLFSNLKGFNNRISLQSRQDLELLPRFNTQANEQFANKLKKIIKDTQDGNKNIQRGNKKKSKNKFSQTQSIKSQFYLKKRIFQHMANKFGEQNLASKKTKRNRSLDENQQNSILQSQDQIWQKNNFKKKINDFNKIKKENEALYHENENKNKQRQSKSSQNIQNGGFEIKITYAK